MIEIDEIDPIHQTGWSVVIEGTTSWLYEEQDKTTVESWAPGPRPYVVRMTPVRVSGRRTTSPKPTRTHAGIGSARMQHVILPLDRDHDVAVRTLAAEVAEVVNTPDHLAPDLPHVTLLAFTASTWQRCKRSSAPR